MDSIVSSVDPSMQINNRKSFMVCCSNPFMQANNSSRLLYVGMMMSKSAFMTFYARVFVQNAGYQELL